MGKYARITSILPFILLLGCSTAAQIEGERLLAADKKSNDQTVSCRKGVDAKAEFASVINKLPEDPENPTMALLTNSAKPTVAEAKILTEYHDATIPCRKIAVDTASHPVFVPILLDTFTKTDEAYLRLIKREISWGDYARLRQAVVADAGRRWRQAAGDINNQLANAHASEIQQRQRVAQAMADWSRQQQQMQQQQALINAMNAPRTTNCNAFGNSVTCQSY